MASVVATAPRRTRPPMLDQEDVEDLDDAPDRIGRDRGSVLDQATAAVRAIGVMVGIVLWLLLPRVLPASALLPVPACGGAVPRLALRRSAVREGVSRMLTKARRNNPRSNAAHDRNRIDRLRHAHPLSQTWAVAYLVRHFRVRTVHPASHDGKCRCPRQPCRIRRSWSATTQPVACRASPFR